jgi:hypothetical protein
MNNQPLTKDELLVQVDSITATFGELQDIMKRPTMQGVADLIDWVKRNEKNFSYALDDLRHEIEIYKEVYPVYPVGVEQNIAS